MTHDPHPNTPSLLTATVGLTAVRISLRALGFRKSRLLAEWFAGRPLTVGVAGSVASFQLAASVAAQVVRAATFFPGRAICLEQSLVLYTLLRRRGVAAQFMLGVQPYPFVAHAWVEVDGTPVNEIEARTRYFHTLRIGA